MAKAIKYLKLFNEMREHSESQSDLAKLLGVTLQTVGKKLTGTTEWTIGEIETLCNHYKRDYYELFRKD